MPISNTHTPSLNASALGRTIRDLRRALGWSQHELGRRAGVSQARVSRLERGPARGTSVEHAERLVAAMGGRLTWTMDAPVLADRRRQHDAGHVRCVAYVMARLRAVGWQVATEVEVGSDRSRGWIDLLAWHPGTHVLLIIEVKTELHDLGAIQRQLGWYEREAWPAARRLGWWPTRATSALLLLATRAMDERVAENRRAFDQDFSGRAPALSAMVDGAIPEPRLRHVAMIDPMSRRAAWLRSLRIDGRRTEAPHADYADFVRAREHRSRAHRVAIRAAPRRAVSTTPPTALAPPSRPSGDQGT